MQIKKLLKIIPVTLIATSLVLSTTFTLPISINQNTSNILNTINSATNTNDIQTVASVSDIEYQVSNNSGSTFAIVKDAVNGDRLYGWGKNDYGQLGIGINDYEDQLTPQLCKGIPAKATINSVHLGAAYTLIVINDDQVYLTGAKYSGLQGNGEIHDDDFISTFTKNTTISDLGKIDKVAAGDSHIIVVINNELWTWGDNAYGQIGNGDGTGAPVIIPTKLSTPLISGTFNGIYANRENSYVWIGNEIWSWGKSSGSGIASENDILAPTKINLPDGKITNFSVNLEGCLIIINDKDLYGWGLNQYGSLGFGQNNVYKTYAKNTVFDLEDDEVIVDILALSQAFGIITARKDGDKLSSKKLYMSGRNQFGQLCNGIKIDRNTFKLIEKYTANDSTVYKASVVSVFATTNGVTEAWGGQIDGSFGIGTTETHFEPVLIDAFVPTVIKGSKTSNSGVKAADALAIFYKNNTLDETKLADYLDISLPPDATLSITGGTVPKVSDDTKSINLSLSINTAYTYPDGQKTTAANDYLIGEVAITGFKTALITPTTKISAKISYPKETVASKWIATVADENNIVNNRTELEKFLTLTDVPSTAVLTISNVNLTQGVRGILRFNIQSSKTMNSDGSEVDTPTVQFDIVLAKLLPLTTVMTPITVGYPNTSTVEQLKNDLFDNNGKVKNIQLLKKYVTILAPVDNTEYFLVQDSWNANSGDGTLSFKIYASKYYGTDGNEKTGSATEASSVVTFTNLQLKKSASNITINPAYPTTVRVDQLSTYLKNGNANFDIIKVKEFFNFENIPSAATFSFAEEPQYDAWDANFTRNVVHVKMKISSFNNVDGTSSEKITDAFTFTLAAQHKPTSISVKSLGDYDSSVKAHQFLPLFMDPDTKQVTNITELKKFVNIESLPTDAVLSVTSSTIDELTGNVSFKLTSTSAYDSSSNLMTNYVSELFSLKLSKREQETVITANTNILNPERVDRFAAEIIRLNRTPELQAYLFNKYLTQTGNIPADVVFSINQNDFDINHSTGVIKFNLFASKAYDADGNEQINKPFPLTLNLGIKYTPTKITANNNIESPMRVDLFKQQLETLTDANLKAFLFNKYLTLEGDLPPGATISATVTSTDLLTGRILFDLRISSIYDADSNVTSAQTLSFNLQVGTKHAPTSITVKTNYDQSTRVDKVETNLRTLVGTELKTYLDHYVDFVSLPPDAVVSVNNINANSDNGSIVFDINLTQSYTVDGDLSTTPIFTKNVSLQFGIKHPPTKISLKADYDSTIRIDNFVNEISGSSGIALFNYLNNVYITTQGVSNPEELSLVILQQDFKTGFISFNLNLASYYDDDSNLVNDSVMTTKIDLMLTPKFEQTIIKKLDKYPTDLLPSVFKNSIINEAISHSDGVYKLSDANIVFLQKYLTIDSYPTDATMTLTFTDDGSLNENQVQFILSIDKHYDVNGVLITAIPLTVSITLDLASPGVIPKGTLLFSKAGAPVINSDEEFQNMIYDSQHVINFDNLALFVDGIDSIPSNGGINKVFYKATTQGGSIYSIEVSKYYDGNSMEPINETKTFDFDVKLSAQNKEQNVGNIDWWWWILIAIGGAAVIGFFIWLIVKKKKEKETNLDL